MREIFITDIHSQYDKFIELLDEVDYDEDKDLLILGGDYFDRGEQSVEMAQWLVDNYQKDNVVLLRGNHDIYLLNLLEGYDFYDFNRYGRVMNMLDNNGLDKTVKSMTGSKKVFSHGLIKDTINDKYPNLLDALKSTKWYHETDRAIYTHSTLPENYTTLTDNRVWEDAVWGKTLDFAENNRWASVNQTICVGHFSLLNINDWDGENPLRVNNVIMCDGGLAWGGDGVVNIL